MYIFLKDVNDCLNMIISEFQQEKQFLEINEKEKSPNILLSSSHLSHLKTVNLYETACFEIEVNIYSAKTTFRT